MWYSQEEQEEPTTPEEQNLEAIKVFGKDSWLWLKDVVDLHVYCLPCVYMRLFDEIEIARQMRSVGYRAFVSKRHHCCNADSAKLAAKYVPGIEVFGGIVLNWAVGGLNPQAVDAAILMGAKIVWFGNMHAGTLSKEPFYSQYDWQNIPADHIYKTRPIKPYLKAPPINVIDLDTGKVVPPVYDIIDLIADAGDIILNTCHISYKECEALIPEARKGGVTRIMVDHAHRFTIEEQKKLADMDAYMEYDIPKDESRHPKIADMIKAVGASRCVITSGMGAATHCHPIDEMRHIMMSLRLQGISEKDIDLMTKITPAKLLALDEPPKPWRGYI